jgi:small conductance mechanosensitive channel
MDPDPRPAHRAAADRRSAGGPVHQLAAQRISRRIDADFRQSDALVRSESAKHRQAVASVISTWHRAAGGDGGRRGHRHPGDPGQLAGGAGPCAALGFGAQRIVQDLLSGFFIITEKQYGFGDLVELTLGSSNDAMGTVEDVTLRSPNCAPPRASCTPSPTARS